MLDITKDGPFRYLHCQVTGELVLALVEERNGNHRCTGRFIETDGEDAPIGRSLREWKAIARRRMGDRTEWTQVE
jgi:hypothetical protein